MTRKIVIADDEPNIVTSLEFLMRRSGYEVWIARDGEEVLSLVERFRPDLVVLDVMMPRRSGYEVCQRLRERPDLRQLKIVMLTAKGREAEVRKGLATGADVYVTKPFSTRELMAVIGALLASGRGPDAAGKPS